MSEEFKTMVIPDPRNTEIEVMVNGRVHIGTVDEYGVLAIGPLKEGEKDYTTLPGGLLPHTPAPTHWQSGSEPFLSGRPDDMPWNWCPECDGPAQCPAGTCCGSPFPEGWTPEEGFMIQEGCWCGEHGIRHRRNGPNCVASHRDDEGNHDFRTCPCASCGHLRAKVRASEAPEREEASQPERQWSESTGMRYCRCRSVILMPGFLASERGGIEHSPERCRVLKEDQ